MEMTRYELVVRGLFGRNRKEKFAIFMLAELPRETNMPEAELKRLAEAKIAEIKVKSGRVRVSKIPMKIEHTDGFTIRTMQVALGVDTTVMDLGEI